MTAAAVRPGLVPSGFSVRYRVLGRPGRGSGFNGRANAVHLGRLASVPGRIVDGSSPSIAADHYHRWAQDVDLLAQLGVSAHRFTLSWSRLQPGGTGTANGHGVAFYDRLIDRLLERGIAPFVGLHHADMPLEVMERGGWLTRSTVDAFTAYAGLATAAFGDRVVAWSTVDEPFLQMAFGYAVGIDAPGLTLLGGAFQAAHHQLLAHGRAAAVLRSSTKGNSRIPFSLEVDRAAELTAAGWPVDPDSLTGALLTLARRYPSLPPVYVIGTGGAFEDTVARDHIHPAARDHIQPAARDRIQPDDDRIAYLHTHLAAVGQAIERGCDLRGYFHSSLLDSWEWTEGFTRHFGLIRVGAEDQERQPRASFESYRELIEQRR